MTQELIDLRSSILEGRYDDALLLVDELEGMGRQAILRNIESFLVRMLAHLIKNQLEERLTNSWVASIADSILQIKKLNLKDNKASCYIKIDEWEPFLEEAIEVAIAPASVEVLNGRFSPIQVGEQGDQALLILTSQRLLNLTYQHSTKELPAAITHCLPELSGGQEWYEGRG